MSHKDRTGEGEINLTMLRDQQIMSLKVAVYRLEGKTALMHDL